MYLEQLNLSYLTNEDRILLRIGFMENTPEHPKKEIQVFFTRRMLQRMWPTMMDAITSHMRINRPDAAFASADLIQMQHEEALDSIRQNGSFDRAYETENRETINGDRPFLLESIKFHLRADAPFWIQFFPQTGGTFDLKLEPPLLHGFCKLLIEAEMKSGWQLNLELPKTEDVKIPTHMLN